MDTDKPAFKSGKNIEVNWIYFYRIGSYWKIKSLKFLKIRQNIRYAYLGFLGALALILGDNELSCLNVWGKHWTELYWFFNI